MAKLNSTFAALLLFACSSESPSAMDASITSDASDDAARDSGQDAGTTADAARPMMEELIGLSGVWGSASDDVWAVGEAGTILHYDGAQWTASESPTKAWLTSVSGSAPDDVWAVGESVVLHWDGTSWTDVLMDPHLDEMLLGIWSGGKDSVFMVGFTTDTNRGLLRRWDGAAWSWAEIGRGAMWDVWGNAPDDVWFGGTGEMEDGFIARGDGMHFEPFEYGGGSVRGLWGAAADDVWAIPYDADFQHWDGTAWTAFPMPAGIRALTAATGSATNDVWAVGLYGMIMHWDGESWTRIEVDTSANLFGVYAASADDAWIVGEDGILLHWDGSEWTEMTPAVGE